MSALTRRERKAERLARTRRALEGGVDESAVHAARFTLEECFDVKVDMGLLDRGELAEAVRLATRIRRTERAPSLAPSPAAVVERYAAKAIDLGEAARYPNLRHAARLLAERARSTGRLPNEAERDAIMAAPVGASLASLRLPSPAGGEVVSRGIDLGALDEDERARLEELVEVAAGEEPGSIFEPRRNRQRLRSELAALAASVAPGPRRRKRVDAPGVVVLPGAELLDDLDATVGEAGGGLAIGLTINALAVLLYVVAVFENRRLLKSATKQGLAALEEDGDVLVARGGVAPVGLSNVDNQVHWSQGLADLERLGYLRTQRRDRDVLIRRGPKLEAFLANREEAPA